LAMGLGVSLLHYVGISAVHLAGATWYEPPYTAMAGMRLDPLHFNVSFGGVEPALPRNALALLTTVVAFGVSGTFLLSLVRDARIPGSGDAVSAEAQSLTPPLAPIGAHGLEPELVPMAWRMS
jgi:NO-binding membrane sensor protein with MHYT domain